jgi:flagellar hook-basal body complex protein FliE
MNPPTTMRIQPFPSFQSPQLPDLGRPGQGDTGDDFANTLMDVLREVNASQQNSAELQNAFMTGQPVDIADVKIAMERASIAMNLTLQVRNKLLEAYQEISRMQV